jgi:hypothetical protein
MPDCTIPQSDITPNRLMHRKVGEMDKPDARPPEADVHPLRAGVLCPQCMTSTLDYDGLLNLSCPTCGFSQGGGCHT